MSRVRLKRLLIVVASWLVCIPIHSSAQEFKMTSEIYSGETTLPISQNLTLFSDKLILDFLLSNEVNPRPVEIVVYDPHSKLLVLLDMQRKIRWEIPDLQLLKIVDGLRRETMQSERAKFLLMDSFDEDTEWAEGWVTLTSPSITYRFKGEQPSDISILPRYVDFLDQFTNLTATDPKKMPPFPRIRLNQSIKKLGWIPSEVHISIMPNGFFREPMTAKSKHVLTMGLTSKDREWIDTAKQSWTQFRPVELTEYRGIAKPKVQLFASRIDDIAEPKKPAGARR